MRCGVSCYVGQLSIDADRLLRRMPNCRLHLGPVPGTFQPFRRVPVRTNSLVRRDTYT